MLRLGYKLRTKSDIFVIDKRIERKPRDYDVISSQMYVCWANKLPFIPTKIYIF